VGESAPENETNLVYQTLHNELQQSKSSQFLQIQKIKCHNNVPHARGLGSSSVALVGAIFAAQVILEAFTSGSAQIAAKKMREIVNYTAKKGVEIEGHADNVEPCCYGALTFSPQSAKWLTDSSMKKTHANLRDDLSLAVLIPNTKLTTKSARGAIPSELPENERHKNTQNVKKLIELLTTKTSDYQNDLENLIMASEDYIHQNRRSHLYKESFEVMNRLRELGVPAVISGAGPTVLAIFTDYYEPAVKNALENVKPNGWEIKYIAPSSSGVQLRKLTI
jgi:homoserine kinase